MKSHQSKASVTVSETGEVIELPTNTHEEIVQSYRIATSYFEAYRKMKNMLMEISINVLDNITKKEEK
jgi:hypothetical protein